MSSWGAKGAQAGVQVGQQYQRTDGTGLVFEIVEVVAAFGPPHLRVRRIDDPTDTRVFALSALADKRRFRAVQGTLLPTRGNYGQIRFNASTS